MTHEMERQLNAFQKKKPEHQHRGWRPNFPLQVSYTTGSRSRPWYVSLSRCSDRMEHVDKRTSRRKKKNERSKRRRQKRKRERIKPDRSQFVRDVLGEAPEWLAWVEKIAWAETEEDRNEALVGLRKDIVKKSDEIIALCSEFDPFGVIANLSVANFMMNPETFKEHLHEGDAFSVEHITLLLLREPYRGGSQELFRLNSSRLMELCQELKGMTLFLKDFERGSFDKDNDAELAFRALQFRALASDVSIRSPGYPHHIRENLKELFSPFAQEMEELVGFNITDVLAVEKELFERQGRIVTSSMFELGEQIRAMDEAVCSNEQHDVFDESFLKMLRKLSKEQRLKKLSRCASVFLSQRLGSLEGLVFQVDDVAERSGVCAERVGKILDFFSVEFGCQPDDYRIFDSSHILKDKPIVRAQNQYLYATPGALVWAIKPELEKAINPGIGDIGDKVLWESYQKQRGDYLEEESLKLLKQAFPFAEIHPSVDYNSTRDGKRCELDGLILCDRTVIFVEMKAGAFTKDGRKGQGARFRNDIKKVLKHAHEQGSRAQEYYDQTDTPRFFTKDGKTIELDKSWVLRTCIFTISLDSLDFLQSPTDLLAQAGMLADGTLPWAVSLGNLRVIVEMTEFPTQLLHYVIRRLEAASLNKITANDELDWFIHYLEMGLYFEDDSQDKDLKLLLDPTKTSVFDDFYSHQTGVRKTPAERPVQAIPKKIREVIYDLEFDCDCPGKTENILVLLDWNGLSRETLSKNLAEIEAKTRKDGEVHDFSLADGDRGVTFFFVSNSSKEEGLRKMAPYICTKKHQVKARRWAGFLCNIEGPLVQQTVFADYPWEPNEELDSALEKLGWPIDMSDAS